MRHIVRRGLAGKEGNEHGASLSSLFYLQLLAGLFEQDLRIQRFYSNGIVFWISAIFVRGTRLRVVSRRFCA